MAQKLIPDDILGCDLIKAGRQYRSGLALLDRFSAAQRYVFTRFLPRNPNDNFHHRVNKMEKETTNNTTKTRTERKGERNKKKSK